MIRRDSLSGEWVTYMKVVKDEFFEFFSDLFQPFKGIRKVNCSHRFLALSLKVALTLVEPFLEDDIHKPNWNSGSDHTPVPIGFLFIFWNDISKVLFATAFIPKACNSLFITLIPKIVNLIFIKKYHPVSQIVFSKK